MSIQLNFLGSLNAISSQESASGASPPERPASPTICHSGADHAHASLSARQAQAMGLMTIATSGRIGFGSSISNALLQSWASRLAQRTGSLGSTLYVLTWKDRITPGGASIFALRASARPISASGNICAGWTTASATDGGRAGTGITEGMSGSSLPQMAIMVGWGTPQARDHKGTRSEERIAQMKAEGHGMQDLPDQVALAGWVTASARDWKDSEGMATERPDGSRDRLDQLPRLAMLTGWQAPTSGDHNRGDYQRDKGDPTKERLSNTGAAKATAIEVEPGQNFAIRCKVQQTVSGLMLTGCSVEILKGPSCGQLEPGHSAWLQGIPVELRNCVHTAMRSISKSPRNSSKRSSQS